MIEIWKEAKKNKDVLHFKNFQAPEITWEEAVKYVYKQSKIDNQYVVKEAAVSGGKAVGNMLGFNGYYFIRDNNLMPKFKGVKQLLKKVNGGEVDENCDYYKTDLINDHHPKCSCKYMWHTQALRFCITQHVVSDHNDPNDVLYWQVLGSSIWRINGDKEYTLEPGDLFYFNQEDLHYVTQNGPRAGFIIDNLKDRKGNW